MMKTDDLIARMSAEAAAEPRRPDPAITLAAGFVAAVCVMVAIFAQGYGLRYGLGTALATPMTAPKTLIPAALGLLLMPAVAAAGRPGAPWPRVAWLVILLPLLALGLFGLEWITTPPAARSVRLIGHSISVCLPSIVLLSAPMLAAMFVALRRAAPVRPGSAGILAGLLAGGWGAALYSLYCTEDTPLFYVVWYGTGIAIVALAGGLLGRRLLRW
jgi:hypothetical protein